MRHGWKWAVVVTSAAFALVAPASAPASLDGGGTGGCTPYERASWGGHQYLCIDIGGVGVWAQVG